MNTPSYVSGTVFVKAYRVLRMRIAGCLQHYELTPTMWSLLGVVAVARDGVRLSEVAQTLNVKAPLVTMLSHKLIERDLITRIPHHLDKRAKLLVMTPKGKTYMKTVEAAIEAELQALLTGLNDQDLQAFKNVLDTIIVNDANKSK